MVLRVFVMIRKQHGPESAMLPGLFGASPASERLPQNVNRMPNRMIRGLRISRT